VTVEELLRRAYRALDAGKSKGGTYRLGGGRLTPTGDDPFDELATCDCSAFVCWCLGIAKAQPFDWLRPINGGWFNTDGIWWDAMRERTGFFRPITETKMGSLLVFPSLSLCRAQKIKGRAGMPSVGHVGIITADAQGKPLLLDCSSRNDGIAERKVPDIMVSHPAVARVWCETVEWE
jgi:hypothetical protein